MEERRDAESCGAKKELFSVLFYGCVKIESGNPKAEIANVVSYNLLMRWQVAK